MLTSFARYLVLYICLFALSGCASSPTLNDWQARWDAWLNSDDESLMENDLDTVASEPVVIADAEHDRDCAEECISRVDSIDASLGDQAASAVSSTTENITTDVITEDLWQYMRARFGDLAAMDHPRVEAELQWYIQHPDYIARVTKRASPYLYFIVQTLEAEGLPMELALLPVVESAFDPFAYSHGRAAGLWQFIPGTARLFKLHDDWWYDGRRDVVASTRAASQFLKRLNQSFDGDWLHALASYNTGPGRVARAVKKNKQAGKDTAFWSLKLPRETSTYVPRLIAISKIIADPERYGVALTPVANTPVFEIVDIDSQIDLAKIAALAGITLDEVYRFNPGFNHWATSPKGPKYVVLPLTVSQTFRDNLAQLPKDQWLSWKRYTVKRGDVLGTIAQRHKTDVATLKKVNKLRGNNIRIGDVLLIPIASSQNNEYGLSEDNRLEKHQQRLANKAELAEKYVVQSGDSFWTIARRFNVSVADLAKWNGMASRDPLRVGKTLTIYRKANDSSLPPPTSLKSIVKKVNYKVRNGDSLARIAGKFNLKVADIIQWNRLNPSKYLQPGQALTLFINVQSAP
ncbi:MAG TPA: LysM peptidoglycan-binding domain-containing protein [Pseudomonadales bacterium]|nr:LysM peptidoglycan-binding domain-containing protein [Pseudomonadales bacterium]